ncbi:HMG box family protein [Tritrichomonas foetus]|uniref:HMG box family protein n=1 Tax=Tritrichomonas foetus TaxID=1144522 RepID=A0A1J4JQB5_9EUKA|nr:HMG box family protein [Tritrichomonas foetus]|eukprot:OHT00938.1 HMG box family protein [Tritrichomonas foetus]
MLDSFFQRFFYDFSFQITKKMKKRAKRSNDVPNLVTPWSIFVDLYKPIYNQQYPNESKMGIYRMLKNKWDTFDDNDKKVYITKAKNYRRSVIRLDTMRNKIDKKKDITVSPYSLFVEEMHKQLKDGDPSMSLIERTKLIDAIWKGMSKEEKVPYVNAAKRKMRAILRKANDEEEDESSQS